MPLKLVSHPLCPYVHRSTTLLHEKGVDFEVVYIDLRNKPDWFLAISPRSRVPVLLVDSVPIFESAVINEFLDETQPPRLLPDDPLERARQRAWIEVTNDLFVAQYELGMAKSRPGFEAAVLALENSLARLEEVVGEPYFAGECFGLVDVAVAPAMLRFSVLESRVPVRFLDAFPRVRTWGNVLCSRTSVLEGVPPGFSEKYVERLRERAGYMARELVSVA